MLEIQDMSVYYRGVRALENINFFLASGELVGLIGPNGAGKSTLIQAMLGFVPTYGESRCGNSVIVLPMYRNDRKSIGII